MHNYWSKLKSYLSIRLLQIVYREKLLSLTPAPDVSGRLKYSIFFLSHPSPGIITSQYVGNGVGGRIAVYPVLCLRLYEIFTVLRRLWMERWHGSTRLERISATDTSYLW